MDTLSPPARMFAIADPLVTLNGSEDVRLITMANPDPDADSRHARLVCAVEMPVWLGRERRRPRPPAGWNWPTV
jgi:hypothetical protein